MQIIQQKKGKKTPWCVLCGFETLNHANSTIFLYISGNGQSKSARKEAGKPLWGYAHKQKRRKHIYFANFKNSQLRQSSWEAEKTNNKSSIMSDFSFIQTKYGIL